MSDDGGNLENELRESPSSDMSEMRFAARGQMPSSMSDYPSTHFSKSPGPSPPTADPTWLSTTTSRGSAAVTISEPTGWWGTRDATRPWRERPSPQRRRTIPPEQEERWVKTKERVFLALNSTLGYTAAATHEVLELGTEALRFAPIPGLSEAARVLLTIWNSLQLVETNRLACLRLTERCADILLSVREEVHEAGDQVGDELSVPLMKLTDSFKSVHILLQKQVHRPFLKRYLKRDDVLRSINGCDAALSDALGLFSVSIQIRTLKQLQAAEERRKADMERILGSIALSRPLPDVDITPKPAPIDLPASAEAPPAYSRTGSSNSTGKDSTSNSSGGAVQETVQSPPPTPDSLIAAGPNASQVTLHGPPSAEDIQAELTVLVERQNTLDHALDAADLRALMRAALATSSDAEMIRVLQVQREEMPEAIKTLQRALEREREKEDVEQVSEGVQVKNMGDQLDSETTDVGADVKGAAATSSAVLGLTGLKRRLTFDSTRTKSSRTSSKKTDGSGKGCGSGWTARGERDTLDREFIESGIDALRRLSQGQELNLPSWTITRYEVDLEEKIGIGYFSDVYKATWRHHTVAVKVLAPTTPQKLFLHEMAVWKTLDHPHVLSLLGASSARGDPPWFFVSPYMKNSNLVTYLKNSNDFLEGTVEKKMVYQIAKGMEYLHKKGVMHGDLKGTNVLIDDNEKCVIADFGQSEMKSEAYRISGDPPPHGTLRWQAPEIIGGFGTGHLTPQVDVYAFAIVCIEVFGRGALPWPLMNDDTVRHLVLTEDKRPPIPVTSASGDLKAIVEACWARDAAARPPFRKIVRDLKKKGLSKYAESPLMGGSSHLYDDDHTRKTSPSMKPLPLPSSEGVVSGSQQSSSSRSSLGPSPPPSGSTAALSPGSIPMQRIITPIREEDKALESNGASPVEYKPIQLPDAAISRLDRREPSVVTSPKTSGGYEAAHGTEGSSPTDSSSSAATRHSSSDFKTDSSGGVIKLEGPGLDLVRLQSPPPADEVTSLRKNESRYRLCLQHDFHASLTLPLWEPCPVKLGAVGYLSRPSGSFVTLFNAFDPSTTSNGRAERLPNLYGYGKVTQGSQRVDRRNAAQRGLDIIQGLLWFRSRASGDFQQNVSRRVSFPLRAGHKTAYLYAETTLYNYIEDLKAPKAWFVANIDRILELYGKEHRLQKEDVYLVIGSLNAPDYGLFVNHNNPDGQVHFNVFPGVKPGQKWGAFSIDTESDGTAFGGPSYHEDVPGKHAWANKVSEYYSNRPWDTVLLARLRFRPDEDTPTAL